MIQTGSSKQLYHQPKTEYVAGLFGDYNLIDPKVYGLKEGDFHLIDKKVLVRPEQIAIVSSDSLGMKCTIVAEEFQGSHYMLYAKTKTDKLIITSEKEMKPIDREGFIKINPIKVAFNSNEIAQKS